MTIKSFFSPKTRRGRAIRTFFQALLGILTFVAGFLMIPGFNDVLASGGVVLQASAIAGWIGVISYLQNAFEAFLKYLDEK